MAMSADTASMGVIVEKRSSPAAVEEANTYEKFPEVDDSIKQEDEPILPDHYYDDGKIPVFKPVRLCCCCFLRSFLFFSCS